MLTDAPGAAAPDLPTLAEDGSTGGSVPKRKGGRPEAPSSFTSMVTYFATKPNFWPPTEASTMAPFVPMTNTATPLL